ncbi:MAG: alanine/ornithine racemase family PLP-dependent enzyme [Clostridiales bacterium]|nr:alanine/ornithine racemase family PLP-dependent enzyme [Candidatus Crickella caballi]
MYPRVIVNLEHIRNNVRVVKELCAEHGIRIVGVTKVFSGDPKIAQCYVDGGLTMTGDSRVDNLELQAKAGLTADRWLIRPPMLSEVPQLVKYADASLDSEIETIRAINEEVLRTGAKPHKVVLMVDLGDIREGYVDYDEMVDVALEVEKMKGVYLYGIGVNLTCFSFITPDTEKMQQLADLRKRVSDAIGRPLDIVSGGNSGTIDLMMNNGIPEGVDSLRLGESLLFGKERAKYSYLPGTFRDTFTLECEIVELKEKPSLPWGTIGADSYGNKPTFTDRGEHRIKAICALGKQDFDPEICTPLDPGIIMLGASSDHLMLDVTESEKEYKVGDVIQLELGYFAVMRAFTSRYVERVYVE